MAEDTTVPAAEPLPPPTVTITPAGESPPAEPAPAEPEPATPAAPKSHKDRGKDDVRALVMAIKAETGRATPSWEDFIILADYLIDGPQD